MVLVRGIDPKYLVQGIGPKLFWSKVLKKGLKLYKEEKIIRLRCSSNEYLMKREIKSKHACYGFMVLCLI